MLVVKVAVAFGFFTDVTNFRIWEEITNDASSKHFIISNFHGINVLDRQICKNIG